MDVGGPQTPMCMSGLPKRPGSPARGPSTATELTDVKIKIDN